MTPENQCVEGDRAFVLFSCLCRIRLVTVLFRLPNIPLTCFSSDILLSPLGIPSP